MWILNGHTVINVRIGNVQTNNKWCHF
jgi:hypothetical protein